MARIGEQGVRPGYLRASWWMVDSRMARVGKQRMRMARVGKQGENWIRAWREVDSCMARIGEQGMRPGYLSASWCGFVHGESWKTGRTHVRVGETSKTSASFQHFFCRGVVSSWLWWLRRGFSWLRRGFWWLRRGFWWLCRGFWWLRRGFWWLRRGFWWFRRGFWWLFCGRLLYLPQGQQVSYLRCAEFRSTKASKFAICVALSSEPQRSAIFRPALR